MPQTSRRTRASQSKLRRLLHMGLPELACRSRQEAFKWVERIHSSADVNSIRLTRRVVHRESLSRFLRNAAECFFPGPLDSRLPGALALAAPDHYKDVPTTADKLLRGTFDLLGYRDLDFGKPPDWHLDPVSGCQAPFVHWTRLDPLDYTVVGDSKVIWELNRHQWFVHLGQAYRLTRDERYAWAVVRYLQAWLRANPPGMGINW